MRLLKFYATWCEPCKALSKVVERNKDIIPSDWEYVEVDIDQDMNSAKALQVRGVPTMVILTDDNQEVRRHVGMLNDRAFEQFLAGR
jgi:thioredoxin-like negative regulator of GroEL